MNKEAIIRLLTGAMAAGLRRALLALSGFLGATAGTKSPDGTTTYDPEQISVALATFLVPAVWSWWEKRVKSKQAATALIQVAAGSTLKEALGETTALKKVEAEIVKTQEPSKP